VPRSVYYRGVSVANLLIKARFFYKDVVKTVRDDCSLTDTHSMIISHSEFSSKVFISTAIVWAIVYFCVWKGIKSSSYVVWITVPLPIFFILIMVLKGLTLEGSDLGLRMYLLGHNERDEPPDWG
jgi:SNF family Na+-dependent transporter